MSNLDGTGVINGRISLMTGQSLQNNERPKVHPSKRDAWIVALIWFGVVIIVASTIGIITSPTSFLFRVSMILLSLSAAGFCLWVLYVTYYRLTETRLIIRCGPFTSKISLEAIEEVKPSRNPLSSPACSLDRLHIKYQGSRFGMLISPRDKRQFLEDLVASCPQLELDGEKAVLRANASGTDRSL